MKAVLIKVPYPHMELHPWMTPKVLTRCSSHNALYLRRIIRDKDVPPPYCYPAPCGLNDMIPYRRPMLLFLGNFQILKLPFLSCSSILPFSLIPSAEHSKTECALRIDIPSSSYNQFPFLDTPYLLLSEPLIMDGAKLAALLKESQTRELPPFSPRCLLVDHC